MMMQFSPILSSTLAIHKAVTRFLRKTWIYHRAQILSTANELWMVNLLDLFVANTQIKMTNLTIVCTQPPESANDWSYG